MKNLKLSMYVGIANHRVNILRPMDFEFFDQQTEPERGLTEEKHLQIKFIKNHYQMRDLIKALVRA